ncbi:MAG: DUF1569 domain-containing protein [Planctomycetota bacterium]
MRTVSLRSLDDYSTELDRIASAAGNNTLVATGHWTPGQILGHLSSWIDYAYNGYPLKKAPRPVQWILRLGLRRILKNGMKPGIKLPGTKTGTVGDDVVPFDDAKERLLQSIGRLQSGEPAKYDSPAFGVLTDADRISLNLRHAELHLSFLDFAEPEKHGWRRRLATRASARCSYAMSLRRCITEPDSRTHRIERSVGWEMRRPSLAALIATQIATQTSTTTLPIACLLSKRA